MACPMILGGVGEYPPGFDSGAPTAPTPTPVANPGSDVCAGVMQVVRVTQGHATRVSLRIVDRTGQAVFAGESEPDEDAMTFRVVCKETDAQATPTFDVEGSPEEDDADGIRVTVDLSAVNLRYAGIFLLDVVAELDGAPAYSTRYFLEIQPSLTSTSQGPLTIAEVRMALRDTCAERNVLLGAVEFSDQEILAAIRLPISEFNATGMPITSYTVKSFPYAYRYFWLMAVCGQLLRLATVSYYRNDLDYNAGGVTFSQNAQKRYLEIATQMLNEWKAWVRERKAAINLSQGFGMI